MTLATDMVAAALVRDVRLQPEPSGVASRRSLND
jgi:hypothetical protein